MSLKEEEEVVVEVDVEGEEGPLLLLGGSTAGRGRSAEGGGLIALSMASNQHTHR
jgi:hypothetical protein